MPGLDCGWVWGNDADDVDVIVVVVVVKVGRNVVDIEDFGVDVGNIEVEFEEWLLL